MASAHGMAPVAGDAGRRRAWRARLMRRTGVFGKDLLQYTRIPLAIGVLLLVLVIGLNVASAVLGTGGVSRGDAGDLFGFGLLAVAFSLGLGMAAQEEEEGTRAFLGRLPVPGLRLLVPRLAVGAVLWSAFLVLTSVPMALAAGSTPGDLLTEGIGAGFWPAANGLVLVIALFLTGMAAGSWVTRNVVAAALIGGIAHSLYWMAFLFAVSVVLLDESLNVRTLLQLDTQGYSTWAHATWGVLMAAALAVRYHTWTEGVPGLWERLVVDSRFLQGEDAGRGRSLRIDPARVLARHGLAWAAVAGVAAFVLVDGAGRFGPDDWEAVAPQFALILSVACAFLGAAGWHRGEREPMGFFLGGLPVPMRAFVNRRLRAAAFAAMGVGAVALAGGAFGGGDAALKEGLLLEMVPLALVGTVSVALLGLWIRQFQRSLLVAGLMTAILGFVWMMSAWLLVHANLGGIRLSIPERVELVVWPLAVMIGAPSALIHLTVRGSLVPELNEGPRTALLALCWVLALVWGPMLVTCSPLDLLTMLTN